MQEMTLSTLFAQGQIRLSEISVFNWGSFHNLHTARIDPEGTLITGDNGAGKSTFIDGLMALLQPASKASFNVAAAQGDRSDRTLLSYMRGSFGSEHDGAGTRVKNKREKAVTTALRALYTADDGSMITLIGLFWVGQGQHSLSEVNRLYMIASRNVQLTEVLEKFADGNTRQLKQHFNPKTDARVHYFDSKFEDYQEMYRKYLFMDNKNAPALLSRALGLKKIDDLTKLIRELVLEPSQVRALAQTAVNEFADLEANYKHLVDAREQVLHLQKLPELAVQITALTLQLNNLQLEKQAFPAYLGELYVQFWTEKIHQLEQEIQRLHTQFKQLEQQEHDAEKRQERCHEDYLQVGGNRIENLQKELELIQRQLKQLTIEASRYQEDAQQLQLQDDLTEQNLIDNQKIAHEQLLNIGQEKTQRQDEFAQVSSKYAQTQQQLKETQSDIQEIETRPNSNIH
ncbi:ATP-binding protein, partial [Acinetobacter sp. 207]